MGKTLSKVTLWSAGGHLLDRKVRPNEAVVVEGICRLDAEGIGAWLIDTLSGYSSHPIQYIVPVGHGAGVAALHDGALAFLPLDYEQPIPPAVIQAYARERDPFARTGSPALPDGLNLGAQLAWLEQLYPAEMKDAVLLPWAQYWAWFLSGEAATEVTSLGCHSDLWAPAEAAYSPLARRKGWAAKFAQFRAPGETVGVIRPALAARTGLPKNTQILAGLHDSNAALLAARGFAEIAGNEATVLSTGTWFVAMRLTQDPLAPADLPEGRDCLINVDAYGRCVPSARFMGGREIETVIEIDTRRIDIKQDQPALCAAVQGVVESGAMLLPTLAPGTGPFPTMEAHWVHRPEDWYARRAAMCLYAALVASTSLDLIGSRERLLIEGRFAEAEVFVRALAALRPDTAVYTANAHNDVSFGALRLIDPNLRPQGELTLVSPLGVDLEGYCARWQAGLQAPA